MKTLRGRSSYGFGLFLVWSMIGITKAELVNYPAPRGLPGSGYYSVRVTQDTRTVRPFVYLVRSQRSTNPHKDTSWVTFSFAGKVRVTITALSTTVSSCRVLPAKLEIHPRFSGNTVEFDLDTPGQVAVEINGSRAHPMLVFANPLETDVPQAGAPGVQYFGPGVHTLQQPLVLRAGQTIYLAGGAYVKGRITGANASNARIMGRGILSGEIYGTYNAPMVQTSDWATQGVLVEGITIVNAPYYNILLYGSGNVVRNVKAISWRMKTDAVGMGPQGLVENCFFKVNDDAVKLYHSGMEVRDCVFWQMENGAVFQISWNMPTDQSGFWAHDCNVIYVEHATCADNRAIFSAVHGGAGFLSNYLFENIHIESANWRLLALFIKPNRVSPSRPTGSLSNITFRRVSAYGALSQWSVIQGWDGLHDITDVTFEDSRMNGKLIHNAQEGRIWSDPKTTRNIRFQVTQPGQ